MCRVLVTQDVESFVVFRLLDQAQSSEVAAGGRSRDQVVTGEKCLSSTVVSSAEVNLSKPKSILGVPLTQEEH